MPQFSLKIDLGNDAMQDPEHVSRALREIATYLDWNEFPKKSVIMDRNGNIVGHYEVVPE